MTDVEPRWRAHARDLRRSAALFGPLHAVLLAVSWDVVSGSGPAALRVAGWGSTAAAIAVLLWWAAASLGSDAPRRDLARVAAGLGLLGLALTAAVTVVCITRSDLLPWENVTAVVFAFAGGAAVWVSEHVQRAELH